MVEWPNGQFSNLKSLLVMVKWWNDQIKYPQSNYWRCVWHHVCPLHSCHNSADCLSDVLIGKWCIFAIIVINQHLQHFSILFIFRGGHESSFIYHVNSVKMSSTKFVYLKIDWHFICNLILLILCLIICVFMSFYIFITAL